MSSDKGIPSCSFCLLKPIVVEKGDLKSRYLPTLEEGPWGQLRPLLSNLIVCKLPLTLLMDQKVKLVCYSSRS